jgi:hypothetical protein
LIALVSRFLSDANKLQTIDRLEQKKINKYSTDSQYEGKGGAVVKTIALMMAMVCLGLVSLVSGAENTKYPAPRFPSYLRPPKSIDDIMPFARAAVRQTGGRTPLGLVEKGMVALIVNEVNADVMVMQAIKRAYDERGVKVYIVSEHELLGINKEEAQKAIRAMQWYTSEQGYMEVRRWMDDLFVDPEVPKKWLKERRPDLYNAVYAKGEEAPQKERSSSAARMSPNLSLSFSISIPT